MIIHDNVFNKANNPTVDIDVTDEVNVDFIMGSGKSGWEIDGIDVEINLFLFQGN